MHYSYIAQIALLCLFLSSCMQVSAQIDTDHDGFSDKYEEQIGTDPRTKDLDSDTDGIPDGAERRLGTDPHLRDSDGDGVADGDEDADDDGLSNAIEIKLRLDPKNKDSDGDGVEDEDEDSDNDGIKNGREIRIGTEPFNPDTDGDGLSDGKEFIVSVGSTRTDPLNPDTDGDGIPDGKDPIQNTPKGARDVLIARRALWECAGADIWFFREYQTFMRYYHNAQGQLIRQERLPEIMVINRNSGIPCNIPPPKIKTITLYPESLEQQVDEALPVSMDREQQTQRKHMKQY